MKEEYGFTKFELKFVRQHKPTLFFYEDSGKLGFGALEKFFVEELGYEKELLKTLVIKYPAILSKEIDYIKGTLKVIEGEGFTQEEAVKLIFECPKLFSFDLAEKI